jgi:hypothetical protein
MKNLGKGRKKMNNDEYMDNELKIKEDLKKLDNMRENKKRKNEELSQAVKSLLLYAGFLGAIISALAYLIITIVMVKGASTDLAIQNQILFSILGALTGLLISFLLRYQGIIYAKQNSEAKEIMKEYRQQVNKTKPLKKLHTISWYILWATIRDIFMKGVTIAVSTWFVLYIFIEGSGNWSLIGLAIANIFMFTGFGLVGLATVYDKYLEEHIPVIKERIEQLKKINKDKEKENQKEKHSN